LTKSENNSPPNLQILIFLLDTQPPEVQAAFQFLPATTIQVTLQLSIGFEQVLSLVDQLGPAERLLVSRHLDQNWAEQFEALLDRIQARRRVVRCAESPPHPREISLDWTRYLERLERWRSLPEQYK